MTNVQITLPQNLSQLMRLLNEMLDTDDMLRRDLMSAVSRTANMIGRNASELPCDVRILRAHLLKVHPAQHGLTAKSLSNVKASLSRALTLAGVLPTPRPRRDRSAAWVDFLASADAPHQAFGLSRFVSFCGQNDIQPADVDDTVLGAYERHLDATLLTNDPRKVLRETVITWNCIVSRANLPFERLSTPPARRRKSAPLERYSPAFLADLAAYKDRLSHADPIADDGPSKPLRPTSIRNVEAHVRQYLDALTATGQPTETFEGLHDLVAPARVKAGFDIMIKRSGGKPPVGLKNIAGTLLAIARHHVLAPKDQVDFLAKVVSRLFATKTSEGGMSAKNVERLGQFDDWENVVRLVALPERLIERADGGPKTRKAALDAMFATAIAILLACPMRAQNLTSLDQERHLSERWEGRSKRFALAIDGVEVKNSKSIDVDLGEHASRILNRYLREYRHVLADNPTTAFFPQRSGRPRNAGNFGKEISDKIYRETGLEVHPHLFRHLAAKLYLERTPGDYETVRRLLGHKKLDTTMTFYARLDNKWAFRHYDEAVLADYRRRDDA